MELASVVEILSTDDGSLPDINLDFGSEQIAADAYELIQSKASCLVSTGAYYWSKRLKKEQPIRFGDHPAAQFLLGDAEPFHVVFGGLSSSAGVAIPDLGLFILEPGFIALDYRMGPVWSETTAMGLFELIRELLSLGSNAVLSHENNIHDQDGLLVRAFNRWAAAN